MFKIINFLIGSILMFSLYQSCGELQSRSSTELSLLDLEAAKFNVSVEGDQQEVLLEVPDSLASKANSSDGFKWTFVDEDGEEFLVDNRKHFLLLSDLNMDLDLLSNGYFRVSYMVGNIMEMIILKIVILDEDAENPVGPVVGLPAQPQPVVGLPAQPEPVVGLPAQPQPVVGMPAHPQPVIGLPVQPQPVIGLPAQPQPVVGMPAHPQPVIGLPAQPHQPVMGMVAPGPVVGLRVPGPVMGLRAPESGQ